jgi:ribosomal protein S18 acetylase RimI-like enzyme
MAEEIPQIRKEITLKDGVRIRVRRLSSGDGPALKEFNDNLSVPSKTLFNPHIYTEEIIKQVIRRSEEGLDRSYAAWTGNQIIAYFFLWDMDTPTPLLGIGIRDDFQGLGLGRTLMEILIEDAKEALKDGIELTTMPGNDAAFNLYKKMGFVYIGDVDNVQANKTVVKERRMFLALRPGAKPLIKDFKPPVY